MPSSFVGKAAYHAPKQSPSRHWIFITGAIESLTMLNYGILEKSRENKKTSRGIEVSCLSMKYYKLNGSDGTRAPVCITLVFLPKYIASKILSNTKSLPFILASQITEFKYPIYKNRQRKGLAELNYPYQVDMSPFTRPIPNDSHLFSVYN